MDIEHNVIMSESFPSHRKVRKKIIKSIIKKLKEHRISIEINQNELYLIVDEALTNALEHGNQWDPEKVINVTVTRDRDRLDISITDEGIGFDTSLADKTPEEIKKLIPRGRGIYIIRQFCKPTWNEQGNQITLHIDRSDDTSPQH